MKFRPKFWKETSKNEVIDKIINIIRENCDENEGGYTNNLTLINKVVLRDGSFELTLSNEVVDIDIWVRQFENITCFIWETNGGLLKKINAVSPERLTLTNNDEIS